jgi:peptidoglycan/LPS O-acetylase OafA/YrhL
MPEKQSKNWYYGIDSIRFVLACMVLLSHFDNVYANILKHSLLLPLKTMGVFLANAFDGTAAVIVFFIISGFVIHYPNKNGINSVSQFWVRRFLRILIPLAVIVVIGIAFDHPEKSVIWSLFCELIYYALYPLLLKINLSWKTKFIISWGMAAVVIGIGAYHDVLAFFKQTNIEYHGYYWQLGDYITWIIGMPCWLLGVLIAENIDQPKTVSFSKLIKYRLIVYIISCCCCFAKFHLHLSYILTMNIFALLAYKWIESEIIYYKTHLPNFVLEKFGKSSYSLYLCHPVIFILLKKFILLNAFTYPLFILLTVLLAYLFYWCIERPSHQLAKNINRKYL